MAKTFRGDLSTGFGKDFEIFLKKLFWGSISKSPFTDSEFQRAKINGFWKNIFEKNLSLIRNFEGIKFNRFEKFFIFSVRGLLASPSGSRRERQFYYHFSKVFYFLLFAQMEKQRIVQKKKHLPRWQVLSSQRLSFWYIVVDIDNETTADFVINVNTPQIVWSANNAEESSAEPMTWAV